jgi:hypothetical protein
MFPPTSFVMSSTSGLEDAITAEYVPPVLEYIAPWDQFSRELAVNPSGVLSSILLDDPSDAN